jgi:TolB protein
MFPISRFCGRGPLFVAWTFAVFAGMLAASAVVAGPPAPRARPVSNMGTIRADRIRPVHAIGIPQFRVDAGSAKRLPAGAFQSVIAADLHVTGLFRPAMDARVEAAHTAWLAKPSNFAPWASAGAGLFCSASYGVDAAGNLAADVRVYDAASGQRVFGRRYDRGFSAARPERLAHQIADDIIEHVAQEKGVSSTFIAFVSNRTSYKEIFAMEAAGSNAAQITRENSLVTAPCWGARGAELYFTSYKRFNPDLMGVSLDGQKTWAISAHPGNNVSPDWCEARGLLAAVLGKDGNQEIYLMDRGGKGMRRLTEGKTIDSSPAWTADGSKLAFVSNRGGSPQIYVMDVNGGNVRQASFSSRYCASPAWSPDGSRLAYVAQVKGRFEIVMMDMRSGKTVQITRGPGNSEDPTWAPNGEYLAFANDRTGKFQIYRMRADGTNVIQLTSQGENTSPAWGPMPGGAGR